MRLTGDGSTAIVEVNDFGVDYVRPSEAHSIPWMVDNGVKFAIRYVAQSTKIGKIVTYAECQALWNAGIGVLPNYESSHDDSLGGAVAGARNGKFAREFMTRFGYPLHLPVIVSVDTDTHAKNRAVTEDYLLAFHNAANPHQPGVYGDDDAFWLTRHLNPVMWRANATSWSGIPKQPSRFWSLTKRRYDAAIILWLEALKQHDASTGLPVHIQQCRVDVEHALDPNICLREFNVWLPHAYIAPAPVQPAPPAPPVKPAPINPPVNTGEGEFMNVLLTIRLEGGTKAVAKFYGLQDSKGNILWVEWTGPGNPALPSGRKLQAHVAAGITAREITLGQLANSRLIGELPTDDNVHLWTGLEFTPHAV